MYICIYCVYVCTDVLYMYILSSFDSPLPKNRQQKYVHICKQAYYMHKYTYIYMRVTAHTQTY